MPPRLSEFRKVLTRNGFQRERRRDHEIWIRRNKEQQIERRVPVSHGKVEIRTKGLFESMLKQAGKTEEHFYEVLKPKTKNGSRHSRVAVRLER